MPAEEQVNSPEVVLKLLPLDSKILSNMMLLLMLYLWLEVLLAVNPMKGKLSISEVPGNILIS